MIFGDVITAAEATQRLGYANRSSLTRLVQQRKLAPVFTASGERGEQFFNAADIERIRAEREEAKARKQVAA